MIKINDFRLLNYLKIDYDQFEKALIISSTFATITATERAKKPRFRNRPMIFLSVLGSLSPRSEAINPRMPSAKIHKVTTPNRRLGT